MSRLKRKGIYQILNLKNNKSYIGSSKDITGRLIMHRYNLNNSEHTNTHLQDSYNKYGKDNFVFRTIEVMDSDSTTKQLEEKEDYYINLYSTLDRTKGYNKQNAKQGTFSKIWHEKNKDRQKVRFNQSYYEKHSALIHLPEEQKQSIIQRILRAWEYGFTIKLSRINKFDGLGVLKITLSKESEKEQINYLNLNTMELSEVLNKEDIKRRSVIPGVVNARRVFQIENKSNKVIEVFMSMRDVLIKYPDVNKKALERILYGKTNHISTKGKIFVLEDKYDKDRVYEIRKMLKEPRQVKEKKERVLITIYEVDQDNNIINIFKGTKGIFDHYPEVSKTGLHKVLYANRKSIQGHFFILERNYKS